MKEKAPAYQRYPKQIMADDKVLLMDWDAYGMHNWLLDISWQQDPRGTIPNDQAVLRKWLRSPLEEIWRRVWPQISPAWPLLASGRRGNKGMMRCAEKQLNYSNGNKGKEKYANRTQIESGLERKNIEDEEEKNSVLEVPTRFKVEDFDGQIEFESLCQVYLKAERSPIAQNRYFEAVEWCVKNKHISRKEAAEYIRERAELYCSICKFQKGLTKWLEDKTFEQNESAWSDKPKQANALDKLYGN